MHVTAVDVRCLDIAVAVGADKEPPGGRHCRRPGAGRRGLDGEEMKFTLRKIGGKWLITRVQTVRTFLDAGGFLLFQVSFRPFELVRNRLAVAWAECGP